MFQNENKYYFSILQKLQKKSKQLQKTTRNDY